MTPGSSIPRRETLRIQQQLAHQLRLARRPRLCKHTLQVRACRVLRNIQRGRGFRDGTTFQVTLYRGTSPSRYFIDAQWSAKDDIEIKGTGKLLVPVAGQSDPWRTDKSWDFYAVARAR